MTGNFVQVFQVMLQTLFLLSALVGNGEITTRTTAVTENPEKP